MFRFLAKTDLRSILICHTYLLIFCFNSLATHNRRPLAFLAVNLGYLSSFGESCPWVAFLCPAIYQNYQAHVRGCMCVTRVFLFHFPGWVPSCKNLSFCVTKSEVRHLCVHWKTVSSTGKRVVFQSCSPFLTLHDLISILNVSWDAAVIKLSEEETFLPVAFHSPHSRGEPKFTSSQQHTPLIPCLSLCCNPTIF